MKSFLKSILTRAGLLNMVVAIASRRGALRSTGWLRSAWVGRSVGIDGEPIPWMTYPLISFLQERIKPDLRILEFGSGNSTLWFAARCAALISIEHDEAWVNSLAEKLPTNSMISVKPTPKGRNYMEIAFGESDEKNAYVEAIDDIDGTFDVIVIDGVYRNAAIRKSSPRLSARGVLIVDNTDYPELRESMIWLASEGFRHIDFVGMSPGVPMLSSTSIFYRPNNCFDI